MKTIIAAALLVLATGSANAQFCPAPVVASGYPGASYDTAESYRRHAECRIQELEKKTQERLDELECKNVREDDYLTQTTCNRRAHGIR